jgi:serine/threonine protein kinase/Tfp pilus assembly protein PilF
MSQLLDDALPLDATGRQAWLDALPAEHQDLASALRKALLAENGQVPVGESLAAMPGIGPAIGAAAAENSGDLDAGTIVGPYRLIRELGRGGMGSVWLAERTDANLKRQVALKLPHSNMPRRQLVERFSRERDILASLVHANIARLYDAGVTAEGQPYLALEYVEGEALTTWCDARKLAIAERLCLFLQVLAAVQYAHRQNVIHRDLKPANILVTQDGEVRLLDFGIAKLMTDGEAHESELTRVGGRALSPQYASPEQIQGKALSIGTDVYSLGVVLHELLTGTLPYQMTRGSRAALEEAILSVKPTRASASDISPTTAAARNATPREIVTQLKGDLDTILHKSLKKVTAERYDTAQAFADDIDRYLRGQKVQAKPEAMGSGGRVGKYFRRNTLVTGVAAAVVAIVLAGVIAPWQSNQLTTSEPAANRSQSTAVATTSIISEKSIAVLPFVDVSEKKDQEYFSDGLSEELIDLLAKVPGLHVPARTSSFYFKGKPENIETIAGKLRVANILEGSVRKSGDQLRISVQLIRVDTGDHLWTETYERKVDDIFKIQDDIAGEVVRALKVSLLGTAIPKATGTANISAYTLYLQARSIYQRGAHADYEKAIKLLQEAIKLDPKFALAWAALSDVYVNDLTMGKPRPVAEVRVDAYAAAERALLVDPRLSQAHSAKGLLLYELDWDWNAALAQFQEAIALDPSDGTALRRAAAVARTQGRLDEALQLCLAAIARDPLDTWDYLHLGNIRYRKGEFAEAAAAYRKVIDLNPSLMAAHFELGLVLLAQGKPEAALTEMYAVTDSGAHLAGVTLALDRLGRKSEADAALAILEEKYGNEWAYDIARAYATRGDRERAFAWLDRAYRQHDGGLTDIKGDPLLKALESDLHYKVILRKMKLQE